jgi:NAD(P)-dependent dehydrogenase (short-subunit alcohol dehydrogenase family)
MLGEREAGTQIQGIDPGRDPMEPKVCMVTGASSGLGLATAMVLSRRGQSVVMVCRDRSRGETARARVAAVGARGSVELGIVDLSSRASIRAFATEFRQTHAGLDVLINNAAVFTRTRTVTADGLETMFATNHLGPFLLTTLLLDVLRASAPSRVINVTAPSTSKLDLDDLQGERSFRALTAFGRSKMCNLLFTYELARRLEGTGVSVNAFHPGLVRTKLMAEAPAVLRAPLRLVSAPPEKAANALAHGALAADMRGVSGRFFKGTKEIRSSPYSRDPAVQARLWEASEQLAG